MWDVLPRQAIECHYFDVMQRRWLRTLKECGPFSSRCQPLRCRLQDCQYQYFDRRKLQARERTDKIQHAAGVAPLVVIPGNEFEEVVIESKAGLGVEHRRVVIAVEVR